MLWFRNNLTFLWSTWIIIHIKLIDPAVSTMILCKSFLSQQTCSWSCFSLKDSLSSSCFLRSCLSSSSSLRALATWYWAWDNKSWHCRASRPATFTSYLMCSPFTDKYWKYLQKHYKPIKIWILYTGCNSKAWESRAAVIWVVTVNHPQASGSMHLRSLSLQSYDLLNQLVVSFCAL